MPWISKSNVGGSGTYYGPSEFYEYAQAIFHTQDWLYGEWSEDKLKAYEALNRVPIFGDYMDYLLDQRSDSEYLQRYGMDYSDIHDPRKLKQTSSGSALVGNSINFVSRNVSRLYRH